MMGQSSKNVNTSMVEFENYYNGIGGSILFRWLDYSKARLLRRFLASCPRIERVLELGCGTGSVVRKAGLTSTAFVVGLDVNSYLLMKARENSLRTVFANFEDPLPFRSDSFDLIVMIDAIEHVRSRERIAAEVKRVLTPSGCLMVFTPPYDSPIWNTGERLMWTLKGQAISGHTSPFTRESLVWFLSSHFRRFEVGKLNFNLTMYGVGEGRQGSSH